MDPVPELFQDEFIVRRHFGLDGMPRPGGNVPGRKFPRDHAVHAERPHEEIKVPYRPLGRPHTKTGRNPFYAFHALMDELRASGDCRVEQKLVEASPRSPVRNRAPAPEHGVDRPAPGIHDVHRNGSAVDFVPVRNPPNNPFLKGEPETFQLPHHLDADRSGAHVAPGRPRVVECPPVEKGNPGGSSRFPEATEKVKGEKRAGRASSYDTDLCSVS